MNLDGDRRKVVLVAGNGRHAREKSAAAVGEMIAGNGWHLLMTAAGGTGVMRAVSRAFRDFQRRSLAIGIIPWPGAANKAEEGIRHTKNESDLSALVDVAIFTDSPGEHPQSDSRRSHINLLSADLVVTLPGGPETLSEIRLARQYGKPVIAFLSDEESIHGRTTKQLFSDGFLIVHSLHELIDAARSILAPGAEVRRKTLRIPLRNCVLRMWTWDDAESLRRNANNRNVSRNLFDEFPNPYTALDAERWLCSGQSGETVLAIDVDGQAVGAAGFLTKPDDPVFTCEIGYWLGEQYWGRGICTEALCAVTSYAFASNPDLQRIAARVFSWNVASMRVLEKAGYTREGVLRHSAIKEGRFVDEVIFATLRGENS